MELVDSMQGLGFHEKNPMMFEMVLKISKKRKGGSTNFVQFAEDMAALIVSGPGKKTFVCVNLTLRSVGDTRTPTHTYVHSTAFIRS